MAQGDGVCGPLILCRRPDGLRPTVMDIILSGRGNGSLACPDALAGGTDLILNELARAMVNRTLWCDIVSAISTVVD